MDALGVERTLDWNLRHDARSLAYKLSVVEEAKPIRKRTWTQYSFLDQGPDGACTGFSAAHAAAITPRPAKTGITYDIAFDLYREAQRNDEWDGEDYAGSSVLGSMKAMKNRGYIDRYLWATTMDEILRGISNFGPVVMGCNWYEGMFEPSSLGYVHLTGWLVGGHAVVLYGVDPVNERVSFANSWSRHWGKNGSAYLTYSDLDRLRREQGEFAIPRKVVNIDTII